MFCIFARGKLAATRIIQFLRPLPLHRRIHQTKHAATQPSTKSGGEKGGGQGRDNFSKISFYPLPSSSSPLREMEANFKEWGGGKERENKFFCVSPPLFFPQRREIKETRFIPPSSFSAIRLEDLRVLILPHLPQGVLLPVRRHPQLELLPEDRGLAGDAKLLRQQFLQWVGDAR